MDPGLGSDSVPPPGSVDKSKILDIKPLRFLVPIFPHPSGNSSISASQTSPFACIPPSGPFPSGVQPFYPFMATVDTQHASAESPSQPANLDVGNNMPANLGVGSQPANLDVGSNMPANLGVGSNAPAPVPVNSFVTPSSQANGVIGQVKRPEVGQSP